MSTSLRSGDVLDPLAGLRASPLARLVSTGSFTRLVTIVREKGGLAPHPKQFDAMRRNVRRVVGAGQGDIRVRP